MTQKNRKIVRPEAQKKDLEPKKEEPKNEESTDNLDEAFEEGAEGADDAQDVDSAAKEDKPPVEPEPQIRTRKVAAAEAAAGPKKKAAPKKVEPTDDFVRNAKGEIRKDADGDDMRYAPGFHKKTSDAEGGYVNENGVRFPPGFKFPGGHVGTRGNVVLNRCPRCGNHNSIDEAMQGACANPKCGYDVKAEELDVYEL